MLRPLRRTLLAVALATSAAAFGLGAVASADTASTSSGSATTYLKTKQETVVKLLKTAKTPERDKKVDAELASLMDYEAMATAALGDNWGKRTDAEKKEFTDLLRQLIEKNYKKRLDDTLNYDIAYKGEEPKGGDTLVKTEAKNSGDKRETPVTIDYVVRKKGAGFIVIDLIPEGSSMVKVYNKEFTKILNKDGWDAVIKKMKDKLAKT